MVPTCVKSNTYCRHDLDPQLYGEKGQTEIIPLDNKSNNFERGELDKFTVEVNRQRVQETNCINGAIINL